MEAATSSPSAPITGAVAAIAELPQIELPQATRIAMRRMQSERPADAVSSTRIATTTTPAMPNEQARAGGEDRREAERRA